MPTQDYWKSRMKEIGQEACYAECDRVVRSDQACSNPQPTYFLNMRLRDTDHSEGCTQVSKQCVGCFDGYAYIVSQLQT